MNLAAVGFAEPVQVVFKLPSWDQWTAEALAAELFGQWIDGDSEGTSPDARPLTP